MSGHHCIASTTTAVALAAAALKTVLQIKAPTNQLVKIVGWGVYFDGVTASAIPVNIRVLRQSTPGTMSSVTPRSLSARVESILTTSQHSATVEPANAGEEIDRVTCHPQQWYETRFPDGQEIIVPSNGYVGIECTAAAAVNVRAKFFFEE